MKPEPTSENESKPSKGKPWVVEYLVMMVCVSIVAIAVRIELVHNTTSVFAAINSDLQVAPMDGVITVAPVCKGEPDKYGNSR